MTGRFGLIAAAAVLIAAACGDAAVTTTTGAEAEPAATVTTSTTLPVATTTTTTPTEPSSTTTSATAAATSTSPTLPPPVPPEWAQFATSNDPPARANPVFVVASGEQTAYLHAGRAGGESLGDLWRLDLTTGEWIQLVPANDGPEPRFSHAGVWDQSRRRLVVFAGQGEGFGDFFSDVWAYDPDENTWTELAPDGAGPADRYGTCAGYDPDGDRFLISHGFTNDGRFDDTWAFSLGDDTWTDVTPSGVRPGERCLHACSYDTASRALVLFGGQDNDVPFLGDTWVLGDGAWSELAGVAPSPRKFPAMAAAADGIVLMGGMGAEGRTDDTWLLTGPAGDWAAATETFPTARESHGAAYDAATATVYVFGGTGEDGALSDTWALRGI